jgi:Na+/proline symporter
MAKNKVKVAWWYWVFWVISVFWFWGFIVPLVSIIVSYFTIRKTNKELSSKLIKWSIIFIVIWLVYHIIVTLLTFWSASYVHSALSNP